MDAAWIFPGQGSQSVGMGWNLCAEFPRTVEILDEAAALSGFPLREICLRGPEATLTRTDVLQPALAAVSLACVELLRDRGHHPAAVAGHSLGEFAALYAAGVLSLADTLRLVAVRGRLMHRASLESPGGMIAVKGLPASAALEIVDRVGHDRIGAANFNSPDETVLSGSLAAIAAATALIAARGGRAIPLNVSGAWHSPAMHSIVNEFTAAVHAARFSTPGAPLYMNATARMQADPQTIRTLLIRQLTSPVLWYPTVQRIAQGGVDTWIEVGPGRVLRGLLRRILPDTTYAVHGVATPRQVEAMGEPLRAVA